MTDKAEAFFKKSFFEHYEKAGRAKVLQDAAELAWVCKLQELAIDSLQKQRNLFAGGCEAAYEVLTAHGLEIDPKLAEAFALAFGEEQAGMIETDKQARQQEKAVAVRESKKQAAVNAVSNASQVRTAEANRQQMRSHWATGNYSSRDRCAEQWADSMGVGFKTGRAYLTGTPDPDPWPAKGVK